MGKQTSFCSKKCSKRFLKSEWQKRNREAVNAAKQAWRKKNKDKIREQNTKYRGGIADLRTSEKKRVKDRFENKCCRCGATEMLHIHHIKPRSCGGTHRVFNLLVFCSDCHNLWHKKLTDFWVMV